MYSNEIFMKFRERCTRNISQLSCPLRGDSVLRKAAMNLSRRKYVESSGTYLAMR